MSFPSKELVESLRKRYPVGCRVELVRMDDPQAPPVGTKGTVRGVDDIGTNAEFSVMESFKFSPPFFRQFHRKCLP